MDLTPLVRRPDLKALLRPRSVAIIGASSRSFVGRVVLDNCAARGFEGPVVPVNPRQTEVAGVPTVASLEDLANPPDLTVVQVRTDRVLDAVRSAVDAGARSFVIPGGGVTDSGHAATDLYAGLAELSTQVGVQIVGPNCMGVLDLVSGAAAYIGTVPVSVRRGPVAVLSQSGAVAEAVVNAGGRVALSTVISCGAETTTSMADYVDFFTGDPHTTSVLAFIEGFADPERTLAAIRSFTSAGKTFVACLVGRSEVARRGVTTHSGRLAPTVRVATAALRQAGAVIAADLDELLAYGEILSAGAAPRGPRLHLVTNSGGEANLVADLAEDAGLELPPLSERTVAGLRRSWPRFHVANPLDPWGVDAYASVYPAALRAVADEPGDILAIAHDQQVAGGEYERDFACFLAEALASLDLDDHRVRVLLSPTADVPPPDVRAVCQQAGIVLLRGARPALRALAGLAHRRRPARPVAARPRTHNALSRTYPLTDGEALAVLADLGVPTPHVVGARTAEQAVHAAGRMGGPVVLKGSARGLHHKSDLGLVRVGLSGGHAVREAATAILAAGARAGLELELQVAEMVNGELDVLVGFHRDPQFGPTLLLGLGGIWSEALDTVDVHVGELDEAAARRFVASSVVGSLAEKARGGALPTDTVARALAALSAITAGHREITEIDINPLIVGRNRTVAVDAVINCSTDCDIEREKR